MIDIGAYFAHGVNTGPYRGPLDIRFPSPIVGKVQDSPTDQEHLNEHRAQPQHGMPLPPPYHPQALPPPRRPLPSPFPDPPTFNDDEDIVDFTRQYDARFPWNGYDNINPINTTDLEVVDSKTREINRHRYLLCPRKVLRFILKSRKWGRFEILRYIVKAVDLTNMTPRLTKRD